MKSTKKTRILTIIIVVVLVAAIGSASLITGAIWNEEEAVHIRSEDIENSTLIIGTHLIHLSALTEPLYDIAKTSAEESGQNDMYYKSELADGTWFEISNATSLADITSEGSPVSDDVVEKLFMTHHTKSDGVTYDLRTGTPVNIFDIVDPYDINAMDEMLPLKNQWELMTGSEGDTDASDRIKELLSAKVSSLVTIMCEVQIDSLQEYYNVLADNNGGSSEMQTVQDVMQSIDATRRVEVYNILTDKLDDYMDELAAAAKESDDEEGTSSSSSPTTLMSLATECSQNVQNSIIKYQGLMLTDDGTVYQSFRIKYSNSLMQHASGIDPTVEISDNNMSDIVNNDGKGKNHSACDTDVANLINLNNIQNDVISNRSAELALLSPEILDEATTRYTNKLKAGINAEYSAEVANNSAQVLLNSIISANASDINASRSELEFMISAYCTRSGTQEGIDFIDKRIELTKTFYTMPPFDAFSDSATATIDSHMDFLTKKRNALVNALGDSELDKLLAEKSDLQSKMRSALDKNDLAGAKDLESQIADIDGKIGTLENQSAADLSDLQGKVSDLEKQLSDAEANGNTDLANKLRSDLANAKADFSKAQAGLSDGSLGKQISALRKDGLGLLGASGTSLTDGSGGSGSNALSDDNLNKLGNDVDALIGMLDLSPKLAFPALTDLYNAMSKKGSLDGSGDYDDMMGKIEDAILNAKDSYDAAMRTAKSANDLMAIAKAFLAGELQGSGDLLDSGYTGANDGSREVGEESSPTVAVPTLERTAMLGKYGWNIVIMALQSYYDETGSDEALNLTVSLAQKQRNLGSVTVYNRVSATTGEYIPLSAIGFSANMRYVEKKSGTGTLAQGSNYFGFSMYSNAVTRGKDAKEVEYMTQPASYLNGIHIFEDYSDDSFGVSCVYLSGCNFAVACTDSQQKLVDELLSLFLE